MLVVRLVSTTALALVASAAAASLNRLHSKRDILPGEAILDVLESWSWPAPTPSCPDADKVPEQERCYLPRSWFKAKGITNPCGQTAQIFFKGQSPVFTVVGPDEDVAGPNDDPQVIVSPEVFKNTFGLSQNDDPEARKARWITFPVGHPPGGVTSAPPAPVTTAVNQTTTVVATETVDVTQTLYVTESRAWVTFSDATMVPDAATIAASSSATSATSAMAKKKRFLPLAERMSQDLSNQFGRVHGSSQASATVEAPQISPAVPTPYAGVPRSELVSRDHLPGASLVDIMSTIQDYPQEAQFCEDQQLWVKDDTSMLAWISDNYFGVKNEVSPCGHMILPFNTGRGSSFHIIGKSSEVLPEDHPGRTQRLVIRAKEFKEIYDPTGDQAGSYQVNWISYRKGGSPPVLDTPAPQAEVITSTQLATDLASTMTVSNTVATINVTVTSNYTTTIVSRHSDASGASMTPTPTPKPDSGTPVVDASGNIFFSTLDPATAGGGTTGASNATSATLSTQAPVITAIGG